MEIGLHLLKNPGSKAPEIHGHHTLRVQGDLLNRVLRVRNAAVGVLFNFQGLLHLSQAAAVQLADPPGDRPVVADGVFQAVPHHGPLPGGLQGQEFLQNGLIGRDAVVVVGVDNSKGLPHHIPGAQGRVDRAEGLLPLRGNGIEGRNAGEVLHRIGHLHRLSLGGVHGLDPVSAEGADGGLHPRFYDKHNLMEPGPHRVIDRILHNGLAVGANAVGLLLSAVAGAHAGCHDYQSRFHVDLSISPPQAVFLLLYYALRHFSILREKFPGKSPLSGGNFWPTPGNMVQ